MFTHPYDRWLTDQTAIDEHYGDEHIEEARRKRREREEKKIERQIDEALDRELEQTGYIGGRHADRN